MPRFFSLFIMLGLLLGRLAPGAWAQPLALTPEESAWVAAHPVVLVGHDPTYAPYSFPGPAGQLVGIDIDYLNLIARRTGLKFENRAFSDWNEAMAQFRAGRIDVVTSLGRTTEREAYTLYAHPYTFAPNVIVTRTDTPYLNRLPELRGWKVGVARGYGGLISILRQESPDCIVVEFDSMDLALQAVAAGRVEAAISDVVNASYAIRSLHLANLRLGSVIGGSADIYIGVHRSQPMLAGIIDKAVTDISPLERKEINDRWVGLDLAPSRWVRAFKIAAAIALAAIGVFVALYFYNRRLARELAERRRIQLQLEETHAQLARVSEEKSELLRMVAHDLRSPLTGFQLGTQLLQGESAALSPSSQGVLAKMGDSISLMRLMVDDLVDVQMLEEGRHEYATTEADYSSLLREAVAAFSNAAARKAIRLSLRLPEARATVRTDVRALRQVVDNLISNALKYSPGHSEVLVKLGRTGDVWRLLVSDQGPGVQPGEREKIFEKYGRGSARPTGGEKSTGLGLWIVRRLVTGLHGRVWCEAGAGAVGSAFLVEVPLMPPADA